MAFIKGSKHSEETRAKMSASHKGKTYSDDHKAKISAANKGRTVEKKYESVCACGKPFATAAWNAKFCSRECMRASHGHGLRHRPDFRKFAQYCSICGAQSELVGDHKHSTGEARGILCRRCNLAIGNALDDPDRLRAAAIYLELFEARRAKRRIVYVSGPITGHPDGNIASFAKLARELRAQGDYVINPHEICQNPATWQEAMRRNIAMLVECDTIYLLPGWKLSRGARMEAYIAGELEMDVRYAPGIALTGKQATALHLIRQHQAKHGRPPSFKAIGVDMGVPEQNARAFVLQLQRKGLLEPHKMRQRRVAA